MKRLIPLVLVLALGRCAWGQDPTLVHLVGAIPSPNQFISFDDLGVRIGGTGAHDTPWHWSPPTNLDTRSTDDPPFAGQFPDMHLNLPLDVQPGMVNNLFISDQPEEIKDNRPRDNSTPGATGIYSAAMIAAKAPLRVLLDQTNGTSRTLKLWLLWVPAEDGVLMQQQRGTAVNGDSVLAGALAFEQAMQTVPTTRLEVTTDTVQPVESLTLPAGATAVVQETLVPTSKGQIFSVVTEADAPMPSATEVAALPVLHSTVWKEEQDRLAQFINPQSQPTRYDRILNSFQHARGRFHFPDRVAHASYDVTSWTDHAVQVYTLYESIPGADRTTGGAETDNRGRYGAQVELQLSLDELPPGCTDAALMVLNPGAVWGGRHIVSDGKTQSIDSQFLLNTQPGLLRKGQAATLWRGPVHPGTVLTLSTEPMANISVALWYMLVPIPGNPPPGGQP